MDPRDLADILGAAADPNRLRILKCLQVRPACVCELMQALDAPQSTVSRHLKWLRDASLVVDSREAQWVEYSLAPAPKGSPERELLHLLARFLEDSAQVCEDRERLASATRAAPVSQ